MILTRKNLRKGLEDVSIANIHLTSFIAKLNDINRVESIVFVDGNTYKILKDRGGKISMKIIQLIA